MKTLLALTIAFLLFSNTLYAQNDNLLITEAKSAIEQTQDYNNALKALSKVTFVGKQNPLYFYYTAQAHEGLNNYLNAVFYYEQYVKKTSLTPELNDKITHLRDQIKKDSGEKSPEEKAAAEISKVPEIEQIIAFEKAEEYKYFQSIRNMDVSKAKKRKLMTQFAGTSVYYSKEADQELNTKLKMSPALRNALLTALVSTISLFALSNL